MESYHQRYPLIVDNYYTLIPSLPMHNPYRYELDLTSHKPQNEDIDDPSRSTNERVNIPLPHPWGGTRLRSIIGHSPLIILYCLIA
jgi:hypothetical protein